MGKFSQLLAELYRTVLYYCTKYCTLLFILNVVPRHIVLLTHFTDQLTPNSLTVENRRIKIHQREGYFPQKFIPSVLLNSKPSYHQLPCIPPPSMMEPGGKKIEAILSEMKFKGFKYNL